MSTIQIILILIVASFAGIESVLENSQLERPLIVCTLIGLILGDLKTGLILGGTLEMISLGWLNIGAAMPPDVALAGVISSILVIVGKQSVAAGIAIAIPLATAGQMLNMFARTITVFFQHKADQYATASNIKSIEICHISCMGIHALRIAIPALLVAKFVGVGAVQAMLNSIPPFITSGLQVASGFIVVVGYAMVINMMKAKYLMPLFFLGFVIAAYTSFNLIALGVIGAVFAIIYIQLNPKYQMSNSNSTEVSNDLD